MALLPEPADVPGLFRATLGEPDMVLPGLVKGTVGGLISPGGVGKSFWALGAALSVASPAGGALMGFDVMPGRVVFLSAEDDEYAFGRRLQAYGAVHPKLAKRALGLTYYNCLGRNLDVCDDATLDALCEAGQGARLVVLDTLSRFHSLDENVARDMKLLISRLEQVAQLTGAALMYLHHTSKASVTGGQGAAQQAARGSSVLVDNARWAAFLEPMSEAQARAHDLSAADRELYVRWNVSKQNYGPAMSDYWYRRDTGGALVPVRLCARRELQREPDASSAEVGDIEVMTRGARPKPKAVSLPSVKGVNNGDW